MEFMNMKKTTLLLAGAACLFAFQANAKEFMEFKPYVGIDYAYSKAGLKKGLNSYDNKFNSGIINAGVEMGENVGLEAFFQQTGERKKHRDDNTYKSQYNAYGLDMYGYLPMGCEGKFNLLGSLGLGIYDFDMKNVDNKVTTTRVGYRAGIGAQYNFTDHFAARVMGRYGYIGADSIKYVEELTAGVRYTF